jgi:pimeloyl-ACP methyl ester carboxylesterase
VSGFQPFLAFREGNSSRFLDAAVEKPPGVLARSQRVLLLLHGYNNSTDNASTAYTAFRELLGHAETTLVGVHWPGSNWSGFAFYMQSIGRAKKTADRLAAALTEAARARPALRLSIVAHSMGCRLAMEVLARLAADPRSNVTVERVVLMAAAVPVFSINQGGHLRTPLTHTRVQLLSHFSSKDKVLKYAFRIGQSLAPGPEGLFPVALGSRRWVDDYGQTRVSQRDAHPAGHSDYWGHKSKTAPVSSATAAATREFLSPLLNVARTTPTRATEVRTTGEARETYDPRRIRSRSPGHA